jgi:RimJ/RimL family protein N-acetyltransferase
MTARLHRLLRFARRYGWRETIAVALLWIARRLFHYRQAVVFALDTSAVPPPPESPPFPCRFQAAAEVAPPLLRAAEIDPVFLAAESARGTRCFTGSLHGDPCYFSLVSRFGFSIPGRASVVFRAEAALEAYVGTCITLPQYRGMGLYPSALAQLAGALGAEGCRRLYLYVERENLASIRGVQKAGFRPVASCSAFSLRRLRRARWRILPVRGVSGDAPSWDVMLQEHSDALTAKQQAVSV